MEPQERDLLTTLLARLKNTANQPKDPEADALIRQAMAEQPDAPYFLAQTVLIQDLSLHNAQNQIAELQRQLTDAQQQARPAATSFLGGLFGSRQPAPPAPIASGAPPAGPWARAPQVAAAPPAQPWGQQPPQQGGYGQPMRRWLYGWRRWAAAAGSCARRQRQPLGSPAAPCCSRGSSRCSVSMPAPEFSAARR